MTAARIICFSGSARTHSLNQRLVALAAAGARQAGADVTLISLADFPLPLFDQDLEAQQGLPDNARKLKQLFIDHAGFLIASPEYNSSLTPLLKNTIDWVSRPEGDEPPLAAYRGKYASLMAASPGSLGGLRGLVHLRAILGNIGVTVLPAQVAVARAHEAMGDDGKLLDEAQQRRIEDLGASLASLLAKLQQ